MTKTHPKSMAVSLIYLIMSPALIGIAWAEKPNRSESVIAFDKDDFQGDAHKNQREEMSSLVNALNHLGQSKRKKGECSAAAAAGLTSNPCESRNKNNCEVDSCCKLEKKKCEIHARYMDDPTLLKETAREFGGFITGTMNFATLMIPVRGVKTVMKLAEKFGDLVVAAEKEPSIPDDKKETKELVKYWDADIKDGGEPFYDDPSNGKGFLMRLRSVLNTDTQSSFATTRIMWPFGKTKSDLDAFNTEFYTKMSSLQGKRDGGKNEFILRVVDRRENEDTPPTQLTAAAWCAEMIDYGISRSTLLKKHFRDLKFSTVAMVTPKINDATKHITDKKEKKHKAQELMGIALQMDSPGQKQAMQQAFDEATAKEDAANACGDREDMVECRAKANGQEMPNDKDEKEALIELAKKYGWSPKLNSTSAMQDSSAQNHLDELHAHLESQNDVSLEAFREELEAWCKCSCAATMFYFVFGFFMWLLCVGMIATTVMTAGATGGLSWAACATLFFLTCALTFLVKLLCELGATVKDAHDVKNMAKDARQGKKIAAAENAKKKKKWR